MSSPGRARRQAPPPTNPRWMLGFHLGSKMNMGAESGSQWSIRSGVQCPQALPPRVEHIDQGFLPVPVLPTENRRTASPAYKRHRRLDQSGKRSRREARKSIFRSGAEERRRSPGTTASSHKRLAVCTTEGTGHICGHPCSTRGHHLGVQTLSTMK